MNKTWNEGEDKLKDCPFCGSRPEIIFLSSGYFGIRCTNEKCYVITQYNKSKSVTVKIWDNRK